MTTNISAPPIDLPALCNLAEFEGDLAFEDISASDPLIRLRQAQHAMFQAIDQSHKFVYEPARRADFSIEKEGLK